jgi:hypothetical protein
MVGMMIRVTTVEDAMPDGDLVGYLARGWKAVRRR